MGDRRRGYLSVVGRLFGGGAAGLSMAAGHPRAAAAPDCLGPPYPSSARARQRNGNTHHFLNDRGSGCAVWWSCSVRMQQGTIVFTFGSTPDVGSHPDFAPPEKLRLPRPLAQEGPSLYKNNHNGLVPPPQPPRRRSARTGAAASRMPVTLACFGHSACLASSPAWEPADQPDQWQRRPAAGAAPGAAPAKARGWCRGVCGNWRELYANSAARFPVTVQPPIYTPSALQQRCKLL